jgi:NhaA family Na+:H+ antiporter
LEYWINDGLMTIFLLIGLELEREIYLGELSNIKMRCFHFAALGGMIVPAGLYLLFNYGTIAQAGAGIPMATDIAFALGILSLLGSRVPLSENFLNIVIIDDLGAIMVIAIFYTILWTNLFSALGVMLVLFIMNRMKVRNNPIPYRWCDYVVVHVTFQNTLLQGTISFCNTIWKRR